MTKTKPVRVAIYTRVSTDLQAQKDEGSLDTQEARIRSYIDAREGPHEVIEVFREEGASGKNLDRPALQRMLRRVRKGHVDLVIVTRIDRLSRSLLDFFEVYKLFESKHVKFSSLREQFDTTSPVGRAMLKLMLVFAELEREQTAERTRIAMRARAERGLWGGGAPMLGYDNAGSGRLTVNEEEAAQVRLIFAKYLELRSTVKLMHWLNENGYRQKKWVKVTDGKVAGGKKWVSANLRTLLRAKLYVGFVTQNNECFVGQHEALVDQETFEQVQKIMDAHIQKKSPPKPNAGYPFPFANLVRCECGYAMTSTSAKGRNGRYYYYECVGHQKARERGCHVKRVRAEAVDDAALKAIRDAVADPQILNVAVERTNELNAELLAPVRDQIQSLEAEQKKVEREGEQLLTMLIERDMLDNAIGKRKLDALTVREQELGDALWAARNELANLELEEMNADLMRQSLSEFHLSWDQLDGGERRELLRQAVREVRVNRERIVIEFFDATSADVTLGKPKKRRGGPKEEHPNADGSGWGGSGSPRGPPARVRMAAFVRKVAIQIRDLRRSGLFGGVCVNQGLGSRGRNATARRDAARLSTGASPSPASSARLTCEWRW